MIQKTVLFPGFDDARLVPITDFTKSVQSPRPAVIVCPGGGYNALAHHEGPPVAEKFDAAGIAAFVLYYSIGELACDYRPLSEIALAIAHLRTHAREYGIDPDRIFTCGFSAGGHLAASAGVLWSTPALAPVLAGLETGINRPTGMILCYPVITAEPAYTHEGTIRRVCGKKAPTAMERYPFSLEKHVDATTPPAFFWHTCADTGVPFENSVLLATALRHEGIPFELHIFPEGKHGEGLCDGSYGGCTPHNACWIDLAIRWVWDFKN